METITLDQYCKLKNVNWIDLLKIDTEGLDLEVLRSGESLIKSGSIEYIKIEINCIENNLAEIVNYLTEFNYALIGTLNNKYIKNKLTMFDAYFQKL